MMKAIKYRIYPSPAQEQFFAKCFGCCRKIWNLMLGDMIESYKETGEFKCKTPAGYKRDYPYLKEVDSLALTNKQLDLNEAMKARFDKKRKRNNNFPKFKSAKRSRKSYTTNNQDGTVAVIGNMIKLPKAGLVKAVIHRDAPDSWKLKNATVSRGPDGRYYCSVTYEYEEDIIPVPVSDNAIGFDHKSDGMYMDSEGNVGAEHKYYRESQKKLAHEQKKLNRKQKDSNNYKKQKRRVAKVHKHIANQRMDSRQKASTAIANRYDVACAEDIDLKAISNRKFHNGKSTMDNAYGEFLRMLEYKMKDRGKYFVRVSRWYPSSQICSRCGKRHKMPLSVRVYECECGLVMNRDHNAALNIKREGLRILMETL